MLGTAVPSAQYLNIKHQKRVKQRPGKIREVKWTARESSIFPHLALGK